MDRYDNTGAGRTIHLVGIGMGGKDGLTVDSLRAVQESSCLLGAQRMLDAFPEFTGEKVAAIDPQQLAEALAQRPEAGQAAVLFSGDVGFYSGAASLRWELAQRLPQAEVKTHCGISSVQYLCAACGQSWEDCALHSLHGREGDLIAWLRRSPKVFLLTGGEQSPQSICLQLTQAGLGETEVWVGEALSYPEERITHGLACQLAEKTFAPLSCMLLRRKDAPREEMPFFPGMPDDRFVRDLEGPRPVPMTKSEVRAVIHSKLRLCPDQTAWDVGAGSGSVSVEMALSLPQGEVWAMEKDQRALAVADQNRERFGCRNLYLHLGTAPEGLKDFPAPDRVFLGGTGGQVEPILRLALEKNPAVRVVVSAITLETAARTLEAFSALGMEQVELVQLAVAKGRPAGGSQMLLAQNPVFLLSAQGKEEQ